MVFGDYVNLVASIVITGLATYWVVVNKGTIWGASFEFSAVFAITLFVAASLGFLTFVFFALRVTLRA